MSVLSCFSCVRLFAIPRAIAHRLPLTMRFSRKECWSGLPFSSPEDLPSPGVEPAFLTPRALAGGYLPARAPGSPNSSAGTLTLGVVVFGDRAPEEVITVNEEGTLMP